MSLFTGRTMPSGGLQQTMKQRFLNQMRGLGLGLPVALVACSSVPAKDPRDPWEGWNRDAQSFNDGFDDYVMEPVAKGYKWITPGLVDTGVTNFFNNIQDISVVVNDLLQLKFAQGGADTGRFLINTTAGIGGLVDVADYAGLSKHHEDFDQTLATWGVPSGPYLVVPFLGSTTPRSAASIPGDVLTNPLVYISPIAIPWVAGTIRVTDRRADLLNVGKIAEEASVDHYEFLRNAYFQERAYQIYDGDPPLDPEVEKELDELSESESAPDSRPDGPAPSKP